MRIRKAGSFIISGTAARDLGKCTYDYYVGIDPDLRKSGFAIYRKSTKQLTECKSLSFFDLQHQLTGLRRIHTASNQIIIHIEGAWLISKSNWHTDNEKALYSSKEKLIGERIAKNVGNNHAAGQLIVELCIKLDLSFLVRHPIAKHFKDETYFKKVTKWTARTNDDARSAACLVFGF